MGVSVLGAYDVMRWYFESRYLKGLGGSPEVFALKFYVYWLLLATSLSCGVLMCQAAYEWLLARRKIVAIVIFSLALQCILYLFSFLAYLPDFGWFVFPGGPNTTQRWVPLILSTPVIVVSNLLRLLGKNGTVTKRELH